MSTRSRTPARPRAADSRAPGGAGAWYRQPIVWVGAAVLGASIAGCAWLIVVAERYTDPPLPAAGLQILKMPLTRSPPAVEPPP